VDKYFHNAKSHNAVLCRVAYFQIYLAVISLSLWRIDFFFSIAFTTWTLQMHQLPGCTLKVSFTTLLGRYGATGARVYTSVWPEAIRTTYTRSLPGDSVYFRNSIPLGQRQSALSCSALPLRLLFLLVPVSFLP